VIQINPPVRRRRNPSEIQKEIKFHQGVLLPVQILHVHLPSKRPFQPSSCLISGHSTARLSACCVGMKGHVHLQAASALSSGKESYSFWSQFPLLCLFTSSSLTSPEGVCWEGAPSLLAVVDNNVFLEIPNPGSTKAGFMMTSLAWHPMLGNLRRLPFLLVGGHFISHLKSCYCCLLHDKQKYNTLSKMYILG